MIFEKFSKKFHQQKTMVDFFCFFIIIRKINFLENEKQKTCQNSFCASNQKQTKNKNAFHRQKKFRRSFQEFFSQNFQGFSENFVICVIFRNFPTIFQNFQFCPRILQDFPRNSRICIGIFFRFCQHVHKHVQVVKVAVLRNAFFFRSRRREEKKKHQKNQWKALMKQNYEKKNF